MLVSVAVAVAACGGEQTTAPNTSVSSKTSAAPGTSVSPTRQAPAPPTAARAKRIACGSKASDAAATPQQPRLFAADSAWNRPLPANARTGDPRLARMFRADIARQMRERIGPWIQTADYSTPLYTVGPRHAVVDILIDRIANPDGPRRNWQLPVRVVLRESCGCRP